MDGHQRSMSFSGHFASRTGGNTTHSNSPAGCRQWRCHVVALLAAAPALARPSPCWPSPLTTPVSGVCTASGIWCPAATPADPASSPEIVSAGCGCVPPIIAHFEELSTPYPLRSDNWDDPELGTMLAANRPGVMHLATASGFAAAPPEPRRAGSEALGGRSRNGHVQNCALPRAAPSPSLGANGSDLEICLLERRRSSSSSSLHPTRP